MRKRWLLLGVLGVSGGALAIAACGGDSSGGNQTSAIEEAGADSTTEDAPNTTTEAGSDATTTQTDAAQDVAAIDAPKGDSQADAMCAVFDASGLDEASVAAGFAQVWQVYRCYGCHQLASQMVSDAGAGIVLSGNSAGLGDSGTIFPPNLTGDPATGLGCWSDSQISNAILNGVDNEGRTLCKPMPKFSAAQYTADGGLKPGYPMDAETAQEIVDYLRSLPVVVNQVEDTTCPSPDGGSDGGPVDAAGQ